MPFVTSSAWLLLAVLLGIGETGHLFPGLSRLLAVLCAGGYLWVMARGGELPPGERIAKAIAMLLAGALSTRFGEPGVMAASACLVAAAAFLVPAAHARARLARSQLLALAAFALFLALWRHGGSLWQGLERMALAYSHAVGGAIGEHYLFSATAVALPGFVLLGLLVAARAASAAPSAWGWAARTTGILLVAHILALLTLHPLAAGVQRWWPYLDFLLFNPQPLILAFLIAGLALAARSAPPLAAQAAARAGRALPALAVLVGALGFAFALAWTPPARPVPGRVLLYDRGFLDWRLPVYGQYGQRSGGMFGLLPRMLGAWGFEPVVAHDSLVERHLDGFRCVVLINVNDSFSPREIEDLRRYVERGGSLLVLGDHTGVAGIRGPFNEVLKPFGIRFEFDCATFPGNSWEYSHAPLPDFRTATLRYDDEAQIWVGASLAIDPPARPVLLARYGFSDWGNPAAFDLSYLGDRQFNPGERLGDIVLAAERRYGRGRVLVFGDTSPFQSGALVKSQSFVQRVFRDLTGTSRPWPRALPFLLAVVGLALIVVAAGPPRAASAAALVAVPLGAMLGTGLALLPHLRAELPWARSMVAVIDHSHVERFNTLSWYDDCVGGLEYNLFRGGYLPRWVEGGLARELDHAALLVEIAPARPFARAEVAAVERFVQRGGWLLLTVGWEEREGAVPLLRAFGMDVGAGPLTQFEVEQGGRKVRVNKGWPLVLEGTDAQVLLSQFGQPVVAVRRVGSGGVILVGDSSFLLNRNLEGDTGAFEGNVMFLRDLMTRIQGQARP